MRLTLRRRVLGLIAVAVGTSVAVAWTQARAAVTVDQFLAQAYADGMGHTLPYRLFVPAGYDAGAGTRKFGLVVYLHGAGGRGTDNRGQLGDQMAQMVFVQPENQAKWPVFLLAPQCPPGVQWVSMPWGDASGKGKQPAAPTWPMTATMALLDKLLAEYPGIDPARLYVTGVSMGGYGAWDAVVRYPTRWRSAVPICGGYDETKVGPIVGLPLWAFHAADDPTVPVARTRDLIAALRDLGGNPKYTEFPASAHYGHASWNPAYAEPLLLPWMFDGVDPATSVDGGSTLPPVVLDGGSRGDVAADVPPPSSATGGTGGAGGPTGAGGAGGSTATGGAGGATAVATSPDSGTVGTGGGPGGPSVGSSAGLSDTAGGPGTGGTSGPGTGLSRDAAAGSPMATGASSSPSDRGCACMIGGRRDEGGTDPWGGIVAIAGLLGGLLLRRRQKFARVARTPDGAVSGLGGGPDGVRADWLGFRRLRFRPGPWRGYNFGPAPVRVTLRILNHTRFAGSMVTNSARLSPVCLFWLQVWIGVGCVGDGRSSGGSPGQGGVVSGGSSANTGGQSGGSAGASRGPSASSGGTFGMTGGTTGTGSTSGNGETSGNGGNGTTGGASSSGGATNGGAGGGRTGGAAGSMSGGAARGGLTGTGGSSSGGALAMGDVLAFPGAQGFGRLALGARGKDVYHVTNLNDAGAGSLRDAISQPNRTVVFDVGGVIRISARLVFMSNQTIAGQTAPGGGITIYGNGTSFSAASHTIVRYLRFRMGVVGESGKDTVTMASGHDVIWDHCSMSWGRDGTFDLNQESGLELYNLTLQDSIVSQGLQTHSTGGLVVTTGTSIIRSLYIDNNSRNPKARGITQFINNVVYNWVVSAYILGDTSGRSDGYMVGNYLIPGLESSGGTLDSPTPEYHMYANGNYYDSDKNGALNGRLLTQGDFGTVTWETTPSVPFPSVPVMTAQQAFQYVHDHAGASLWRDPVDDYVMDELSSFGKKGKTISDETSLGIPNVVGNIAGGTTPKDTDQDGMPDAWEQGKGLDPNNAEDRNGDRNEDGWTNLEEYINSLIP